MKVERGMILRAKKNSRRIEILDASDWYVKYRDLKYSTVFKISRALFERSDLELIEG